MVSAKHLMLLANFATKLDKSPFKQPGEVVEDLLDHGFQLLGSGAFRHVLYHPSVFGHVLKFDYREQDNLYWGERIDTKRIGCNKREFLIYDRLEDRYKPYFATPYLLNETTTFAVCERVHGQEVAYVLADTSRKDRRIIAERFDTFVDTVNNVAQKCKIETSDLSSRNIFLRDDNNFVVVDTGNFR